MGVKELWSILTPHAERKPISELRGKKVAIDLAGWVCESLNVVDYFVHPRHHLKNLFFRTCYLIWEEAIPVFVLEGTAPKLKSQVIAKRNGLQFRGVKPKEKPATQSECDTQKSKDKGRTRFNHVLKQCESLLLAMGIQCVQGPGEAEAYCAFLNKHGLVDGVISQDSDSFVYGAVRVYRNFSVSSQSGQTASVDIYDMRQICEKIDFGQHKMIVMALLCGCDYCPDGVGGVGRDSVLKLFHKYKNSDILQRIRSWRSEDHKYTALEMRVDDKTICANCGHIGRTQSHTKSGCSICRTNRGCDESLWKEERLALKSELQLRKKALVDPEFPSEAIINEFLIDPPLIPNLCLKWRQPNIVKFIKQIGNLLQWTEIYCFQKFFPILTRWQVSNFDVQQAAGKLAFVEPKEFLKKRTLKGVPCLEVIWQDTQGYFMGLIPEKQFKEYELSNPKGLEEFWNTIEPIELLEKSYPDLVAAFIKSKEKPKKEKKLTRSKKGQPLNALENIDALKDATDDIAKTLKPKQKRDIKTSKKGLQLIDKFFKQKIERNFAANTPVKAAATTTPLHQLSTICSTPITKQLPSDLESDGEELNLSNIINDIVGKPLRLPLTQHAGHLLHYESLTQNLSLALKEQSYDDLDLLVDQRHQLLQTSKENIAKESMKRRISLDDSFDILVNNPKLKIANFKILTPTHKSIDRTGENSAFEENMEMQENVSYFFNQSLQMGDEFEKVMEFSFANTNIDNRENVEMVALTDSSDDS